MEWNEFKQMCIDAGFTETTDDPIHPLVFNLGDFTDEEEYTVSINIVFRIENGSGKFVFNSGLGHEFIHLNSLDPYKVVEWGKLIDSIEQNY